MILIIDNYDSFTYNLAQYVGSLTEVQVLRNDDPQLYEVAKTADALVFSPGPGWPVDAGKMEQMIRDFAGRKPILGVCLGFQAIVEVFGGKLRLAHQVRHGKSSTVVQHIDGITHREARNTLFKSLAAEFPAMRYHSIVMDEQLPVEKFSVTAKAKDDGEIMAIESEELKVFGLQFHPESIGTPDGMTMIENFVRFVNGNDVQA